MEPSEPTPDPGALEWEERYRNDDTPWDHGLPAPGLREYLEAHKVTGHVLVPGCGRGHDARLLSRHGARVTALDLAPTALRRARDLECEEGLPPSGGVAWTLGDFLQPPGAFQGAFDLVFEHTCLCALPPANRAAYLAALLRVLMPHGLLLAIFYDEEGYDRRPPWPISPEAVERLFGRDFETVSSWTPAIAFDGREGCETMALLRRR